MVVVNEISKMKEPLKYFLERTTSLGRLARFRRKKQLEKKMRRWEKEGSPLPMPNLGKQRVVIDHIQKFSPAVFIETGTYKGKMVYAVQPYIKEIYSIELSETYCQKAQEKFAGYPAIHIIHGQSGEVLPEILEGIDKPCLFWLDAHYSGGSTARGQTNTPVMDELRAIVNHKNGNEHIILIDDARLFVRENDYPTIQEMKEFVLNACPEWVFEVKDDIIRAYSASMVSG